MIIEKKISFIGGDRRFPAAAEAIAEQGAECCIHGFDLYEGELGMVTRCADRESAASADAVVLPLPFSTDGVFIPCPLGSSPVRVAEVIGKMRRGQILFGGKLDGLFSAHLREKGIRVYDYYESEELCIANAIPTAEGALALAMNGMPITLFGANACVLGFGRIGKALSFRLALLGAHVSVAARKASDLARIGASAMTPLPLSRLTEALPAFDVIYNTVPSLLLDGEKLKKVKKDALLIDLASPPGGIDSEAANKLGLNSLRALSLPGKCSPVSAGRDIAKAILALLEKDGEEEKT